jgi:hypothetical protein
MRDEYEYKNNDNKAEIVMNKTSTNNDLDKSLNPFNYE